MGEAGINKTVKVATSEEMRSLEGRANRKGVDNSALMEKAGLEIALDVSREVGFLRGIGVLILVGPGNNGSDGLIAGMHLSSFGAKVTVILTSERTSFDPIMVKVLQSNAKVFSLCQQNSQEILSVLDNEVERSHVIIDAIFGIGINREIKGFFAKVLTIVNERRKKGSLVFAVDVPTGLFSDTGKTDKSFLAPDVTLALGVLKVGHVTQPGASKIGRLRLLDIGIPDNIESSIKTNLITKKMVSKYFIDRPSDSNKGTFGKAFVIGGSENYIGAVGFAAGAAYRAGVGLVTIAVPREISSMLATAIPEATVVPIDCFSGNTHPNITVDTRSLYKAVSGYSSMLFGCGIGLSRQSGLMLEDLVLSEMKLPTVVLDADGLNLMSKVANWWERIPCGTLLTPHPGEMSRLTGIKISEIQSNRQSLCKYYAQKWSTTIVLKGANTVISAPTGETWISPWSDPVLAVAGTGDVLSGLIVGFMAQGISVEKSAVLAVYAHGLAGEQFSKTVGGSGMFASDLLRLLPMCIESLKEEKVCEI